MFGHKIDEEILNKLSENRKLYLSQKQGNLCADNNEPSVIILIKKENDAVYSLSEEERSELNTKKIPIVTIGNNRDISDFFIPDRYFENCPYEGRPFVHGIFDCYTLIREYYRKKFNLILPTNIQRTWEWWTQGDNLYLENAKTYDFYEVNEIKKYDILLLKFNSSVPNHGAIYLGDNTILHHMAGKFSCKDSLGFSLKSRISAVYRHRELKDVN